VPRPRLLGSAPGTAPLNPLPPRSFSPQAAGPVLASASRQRGRGRLCGRRAPLLGCRWGAAEGGWRLPRPSAAVTLGTAELFWSARGLFGLFFLTLRKFHLSFFEFCLRPYTFSISYVTSFYFNFDI